MHHKVRDVLKNLQLQFLAHFLSGPGFELKKA
jgi:hypothetical protein